MDRRIGRSSSCARASASDPQGYQSTGLWACCSRYGLVSWLKRLGIVLLLALPAIIPLALHRHSQADHARQGGTGGRLVGAEGAVGVAAQDAMGVHRLDVAIERVRRRHIG